MSTGGTELPTEPVSRRAIIAVACLCLAATAALVNMAASIFVLNRSITAGVPPMAGPAYGNADLSMAGVAALAVGIGLAVLHLTRQGGWPWLLVTGTVLTAAVVLPFIVTMATARSLVDNGLFNVALGAGPVLVVIGLLGAGSWLMQATSRGVGPVIAGAALAAPLLGGSVLGLLLRAPVGESADLGTVRTTYGSLAGASVAAAIGTAAMLRRLPVPERPAVRVTVVGVLAGVLPLAPYLVVKATGWSAMPDVLGDPETVFQQPVDDWSKLFGLTGLMIFMMAVGLALVLGNKALGAALAVGLVLYGTHASMTHIPAPISDPTGALVLALVGFALGGLAAATRWRVWFAAAACSVVGLATIVVVATAGGVPPLNVYVADASMPSALAMVLLPLVVFAAVTTVATVVAGLAAGNQAPAMIGAVAVAIQIGLLDSGVILVHSDIAGRGRWASDGLVVASGIALLLGAVLVVTLRFARAAPSADAEPPEQPAPALTPS